MTEQEGKDGVNDCAVNTYAYGVLVAWGAIALICKKEGDETWVHSRGTVRVTWHTYSNRLADAVEFGDVSDPCDQGTGKSNP